MAKVNRKQKKRERRKKMKSFDGSSGAQLHRIASRGPLLGSYITADWQAEGLAAVHLLRGGPNGRNVMGSFLIDLWCLGLKDAFGRINTSQSDFQEQRDMMEDNGVELAPCSLGLASRLVAGAARWTRDHGFMLPPQAERWLPMLGGDLDIEAADLSDFGHPSGKLFYVGAAEDLIRRLRDGDLTAFCEREDTDYVFQTPPDELAGGILSTEDEDIRNEAMAMQTAQEVVNVVLAWCRDNGMTPHARLGEAAALLSNASLLALDSGEEQDPQAVRGVLQTALAEDAGLAQAYGQILAASESAGSEEEFLDLVARAVPPE